MKTTSSCREMVCQFKSDIFLQNNNTNVLTQLFTCVRVVKVKGMWQTGNVLHCLWSLREFDSRHSRQIKWRQDLRLCERTGKTVLAKI